MKLHLCIVLKYPECCLHFSTYIVAIALPNFGGGTGTILLDDVVCSGLEERLEHCSHHGIGLHNCDHSQDVGVVCDLTGICVTLIMKMLP